MIKLYDSDFYKKYNFHLHIDLTDSCNYTCNYCYNFLPRRNINIDVDKIIYIINNLKNKYHKQMIIYFLGGEPTLYNSLYKLVLNTINIDKVFYTNFSNHIDLYKFLLNNNSILNISYHKSLFNENLFDKLSKFSVKELYNIKISIMYENNINNINEIYNDIYTFFLKYNIYKNLEICLIKQNLNLTLKYMYSSYLLNLLKTLSIIDDKSYILNNNGKISNISEDDLYIKFSKKLFYNSLCNAGIDSLYINHFGDIYACPSFYYTHQFTKKNGNINNFIFKNKRTICTCLTCCLPHIKKYIIN